jgi:hypothetical protein
LWLAVLAAVALFGAGCGGISASRTVSPLDFFLPGLIKNDVSPVTNAPVAIIVKSDDLAFAK